MTKKENKDVSMRSTKKEILAAYNEILEELKKKEQQTLRPEKIKEEKKQQEFVFSADKTMKTDIDTDITTLNRTIAEKLESIREQLNEQKKTYLNLTSAIDVKKKEINELYGIEKEAMSLAALLETQKHEKETFMQEMAEQKEKLENEMQTMRQQWKEEQVAHENELKEQQAEEKKKRMREKEEYEYAVAREKERAADAFEDEKAAREKALAEKEAAVNEQLTEKQQVLEAREKSVAEKEDRLSEMEEEVASFDDRLEAETAKAVSKRAIELDESHTATVNLMKQQHAGEINVLKTRIETLENIVSDQKQRMEEMGTQLDGSYRKVEEIAMKALDSTGSTRTAERYEKLLRPQERDNERN